MDPIMLLVLTAALETVQVCVSKGAAASDGLALTEKIVGVLLPVKEATTLKWCVYLRSYGDYKIPCIKVIRQYTGLGLKEAKELVERAPCVVLETEDKDVARKMYDEFCNIKPYNSYEYKAPVKVELKDDNGALFLINF